ARSRDVARTRSGEAWTPPAARILHAAASRPIKPAAPAGPAERWRCLVHALLGDVGMYAAPAGAAASAALASAAGVASPEALAGSERIGSADQGDAQGCDQDDSSHGSPSFHFAALRINLISVSDNGCPSTSRSRARQMKVF